MYCMQKIHENLPAASFYKPDTVISVQVCSSGYYATDECKAAGTAYTDYFVVGSYLCPTENNPCPVHVPAPPDPVPVNPDEQTDIGGF